MAMIPTKQLFDEFFEGQNESYIKRIRVQGDRPEVYAYEEKVGKQLIDMDVDDLFEMISTFNQEGFSVSYTSYDNIAVLYRKLFQYYSDKYELIRNPWYDKRMKGSAAYERLASYKKPITWEIVKNAIEELYKSNELGRAKYIECIVRLFYDGFEKAEEIVKLQESMIDFRNKQVRLTGRTVQLDDRCFELLVDLHNMQMMKGWRGDYYMAAWHGGYFHFPIRPSEQTGFDNRPLVEIGNLINRTISERIRKGLGLDINYRMLYLLGFYDYMVTQCGKEETNRLLTSIRVKEDVAKLNNLARTYGLAMSNIPQLKKHMRPYIS